MVTPAFGQSAVLPVGGKIGVTSTAPLPGRSTVNAKGLIVVPSLVDVHSHAMFTPGPWLQAFAGVITVIEGE
ncbi:MAG: hypothetical protein RLZZ336_1642 [Cyanobacteriota bacterium]